MMEIGRLVVKTAGRDAGKRGVIIDVISANYVLVDGEVRRKKVNIMHLEPLENVIKIGKNAQHEEVSAELKKIGIVGRKISARDKVNEKPAKARANTPAKPAEKKAAPKKTSGEKTAKKQ